MSHLLTVEVDWAQGTLQRLIGLIERRSFEIVDLDMVRMGEVRRIEVIIRPRAESRPFDVLCRQIDRLHGVRRLSSEPRHGTDHQFPMVG